MCLAEMCSLSKIDDNKHTFVRRVLEKSSVKATSGIKFFSELLFDITCVSALIGLSLVTVAIRKQKNKVCICLIFILHYVYFNSICLLYFFSYFYSVVNFFSFHFVFIYLFSNSSILLSKAFIVLSHFLQLCLSFILIH